MSTDEGIFSTAIRKPLQIESLAMASIPGVPDADMDLIRLLAKVWRQKYPNNLLRSGYYYAHEKLNDFGIGVPQSIRSQVKACVGWPHKAVRSLADFTDFDGWEYQGGDTYGIDELSEESGLRLAIQPAVISCYMHSCSFLTVVSDDEGVVVVPRSADWSAALWDGARNRLKAVLTIKDADSNGYVTAFDVFLPGRTWQIRRDGFSMPWRVTYMQETPQWNGPCAVAFVHDQQLSRPLGVSRISRPVMALTDMAFRSMVRMETTAEFYAAPKLWFLGADKGTFSKGTWDSLISAINGLGRDVKGDLPQIVQIQQASMQPHSDMLKTIAMMCASEMSVPVDEMGITLDNPSSAEAMAAAERKLTRIADRQNKAFGMQLKRLMQMAVCLRDGIDRDGMPDGLKRITPWFAPTREITDAARADTYAKIAGVNPSYATSTVAYRRLGLTADEINILKAEQSVDELRTKLLNASAQEAADVAQTTKQDQQPSAGQSQSEAA